LGLPKAWLHLIRRVLILTGLRQAPNVVRNPRWRLTSNFIMAILQSITILSLSFLILVSSCSDKPRKNNPVTDLNSSHIENDSTNYCIVDSSLYYKGEVIFKKDCGSCHATKYKTDNYLERVVDWLGTNYLKLYLTKQDSLVTAKDSIALRLKKVWGNQKNSHNFNYSEHDLNAVIEYLR
jgi:hypothetical protein